MAIDDGGSVYPNQELGSDGTPSRPMCPGITYRQLLVAEVLGGVLSYGGRVLDGREKDFAENDILKLVDAVIEAENRTR